MGAFPAGSYHWTNSGRDPYSGGFQYFPDPGRDADRASQEEMALNANRTRIQEAQIGDAGATTRAQIGADTSRFGMGLDAETARRGQDQSFALGNRNLDVTVQGNQLGADTARRGQDLQFQASMAPITWQRERFNSVFPLFQQALQGYGGGNQERIGGQNTPTPGVTVGGVYSPAQMQQQVNAAKANNASEAATQNAKTQESAASRGMSSRSPLVAALMQNNEAQRMMMDAEASREIPFQAAQANAENLARTEALRGNLWQAENQMDINRRKAAFDQQNTLLAALAGIL